MQLWNFYKNFLSVLRSSSVYSTENNGNFEILKFICNTFIFNFSMVPTYCYYVNRPYEYFIKIDRMESDDKLRKTNCEILLFKIAETDNHNETKFCEYR